MKKLFTLKQLALFSAVVSIGYTEIKAQAINEGFNDITTLAGSGWFRQNNSNPVGANPVWFQGTPTTATPTPGPFNAFAGANNAYIAVNFASTAGGTGTISQWLVTPNRTFRNGDVITFYTRKPTPNPTDYPDRLEVRLSTNGASTNVGATPTAVGDFTTMLISINPTLVAGGYPLVWTQYTITISGLPAPTSGRVAFRYFVTSAGPTGANSDYIGIDEFAYTPYVCPVLTVNPTTVPGGTAGTSYSQSLSQTGALGAPGYAVTAGALPPGLTLSASGTISGTPTATGTFNFTASVSDASGCSGSRAYSLTVVCPANPIGMNFLAVCSNASPVDLSVSTVPAGGTFSAPAGVTGNSFDPAAGSQTITYDYTDPYGCAHQSNSMITVNTAPSVTIPALTAVCEGSGDVTLTGESPAGGTYSGTNVSGSVFSPVAAGTTDVIYTYTDANGCTEDDTTSMVVNALPVVTQSALTAVCEASGDVALSGGSPAGGTYSGTNVAAGMFSPIAAGTTDVIYTYTDANGCSEDDTTSMVVYALPAVTQSALPAVCEASGDVTLSGGSPAGGTYTGTNVTSGIFSPIAAGTTDVIYTYTDANGCTEDDTTSMVVNALPAVTQSALPAVCEGSSDVTLSGGSPSGGTYSGTNVAAGMFSPIAAGTTDVIYSYTDANGCSEDDTTSMVVNALPVVTLTPFSNVCVNSGSITLTGGSPAIGDYSGPNVFFGTFDPSVVGTSNITYTFTDANGCTDSAVQSITVDPCIGLANNTAVSAVKYFPNPTTGTFVLEFVQNEKTDLAVNITDIQGRVVAKDAQLSFAGSYSRSFDLSAFAKGIYTMEIRSNNKSSYYKIVVQ
ncbi:MAG: hypothetical protein K0S33_491 [Bacteroidetes bacterium]|jgi:hypothetical protein|nr:hypothetical protein [Bacteroidota bacterium]